MHLTSPVSDAVTRSPPPPRILNLSTNKASTKIPRIHSFVTLLYKPPFPGQTGLLLLSSLILPLVDPAISSKDIPSIGNMAPDNKISYFPNRVKVQRTCPAHQMKALTAVMKVTYACPMATAITLAINHSCCLVGVA